ncbi:hypothetical protein BUE80_DR006503 [Diplocarpon rosae]|nr:hypothetical protein BUE80_DR006503 [Diplocarpon rosae]
MAQSETQSEREASEEPPASYDPDMDDDEEEYTRRQPVQIIEEVDAILHPLRQAANRVGREVERFAEVLDRYNPQRATEDEDRHGMMVDLIELYHEIAVDTVEDLRKVHGKERDKKNGIRWRKKMRGFEVDQEEDDLDMGDTDKEEASPKEVTTKLEDLERWEQEAQTWDLLRRIVELRFPSPCNRGQALQHHHDINQYSSEQDLWEDFLDKDALALERRTVLQWLQDCAEESGEAIDVLVQDLQLNANRGEIITAGWIHTKYDIKGKKLGTTQEPSQVEDLITQLDPDAMTRQGRRLHYQDEYFERAIWLGCYEMLRRGKTSDEIREWCYERTEVWRAVSMSGFPDERSSEDLDSGNPESSALWRRMCFALARNGGGDPYERAVYGILSGDIESVEAVCRSWDDFVFANYNALLRNQFDNYLQTVRPISHATLNFESFDALQFHGDTRIAGSKLIETLKTNPQTASETLQPMKMLQGVLIADTFPNFIYQQGLALSKYANEAEPSSLFPSSDKSPENEDYIKYINLKDHDSLRVLAHVLLVFMGLGLDLGGILKVTEVENVIVAYISFLRLSGKEELIPLYCSQLSGKRKYAILCRNLIDVTDNEQRVTQIKLMRELGLDVQTFVSLQARFLQADYPDLDTGYPASDFNLFGDQSPSTGMPRKVALARPDFIGAEESIDRIDLLLIRSLEWYLLVDGMWNETLEVGTLLYQRFYKHMHLSAAKKLCATVPYRYIVHSKTYALLGDYFDVPGLDAVEQEDITEVFDGSADVKRQLKKHLIAQAKSFRELESLIECLDAIETCTSAVGLMREKSSPPSGNSQRKALLGFIQEATHFVQPLLKGWLLTKEDEEDFMLLRNAYLPETLLAYLSILQFAGNELSRQWLMECMDISALIAEENSDLLDVFMRTGRLRDLVDKLASASKDLVLRTSDRGFHGSRSKKLRLKGWTPDLWTLPGVRP